MTLSEKIIAAHAVPMARARDLSLGDIGAARVVPGDSLFARADVRFSHEYVTAMAEGLMRRGFGPGAVVTDPDSVVAFRDHLILLESVMPATHRAIGLAENARGMARRQAEFARRMGIHLCGEVDSERGGAEGICHQKVIEDLALPGQLVVGTDSHTCTAGALGCLAFGVGSTDMANAWVTGDVRVTVPETVRCVLLGRLRAGVCAKDVALAVLAMPYFKSGEGVGKIVEFCGAGAASLDIDERATLTNMAVEAGCVTGIVEADEVVVEYLATRRSLARSDVRQMIVKADRGAEYAETLEMNLSEVVPMVATPGDPRNSVPLSSLGAEVRIDIAYGGSCTGGKCADMDMYAAVVRSALDRGEKIHPSVRFYIQFGSQAVRRYAMERGYLEMFEKVGATLLEPACGACIGAGPGVSTTSTEVTVSAQNRNYPGRSGPGQVYLASPWVVAGSLRSSGSDLG
jgi:3-isopropylmalate/(R)-2-methylmalate dehydratase large subunit